ncbi:hypothetical protein PV326_002146 [Microctonus aethiopoides]|nr:hypothetical protein PV326_002146 [Microctonus aethiopoides]
MHSKRHRDYLTTTTTTITTDIISSTSGRNLVNNSHDDPQPSLVSVLSPDSTSEHNPCLDKYCGAGRKCHVSPDGGVALCVCLKKCGMRHRPVCGSDGKVYANHCELHRAACNRGKPLTVSRLMRCLHQAGFKPATYGCY